MMYKKIMEAYVRAWEDLDSLDALDVRSIRNLYEKALGYIPPTVEDLRIIQDIYYPDCTLDDLLEKDTESPITDRKLLDKCIERGETASWDDDPDLEEAANCIERVLHIQTMQWNEIKSNISRIMLFSLAAGKAIGEEQQRARSHKVITDLIATLDRLSAAKL